MAQSPEEAGVPYELDGAAARAEMLRNSETFLLRSVGE